MKKINPNEAACYLLDIEAFRLRSQKTLEDVVFNGTALKIESLYTEKSALTQNGGRDIFDQNKITLSVNDYFIKGIFTKMKDTRMYFYTNSDNETCVITLSKFTAFKDQDLTPLEPLNTKRIEFAFAMHAVFPTIDMVAAKIMSV